MKNNFTYCRILFFKHEKQIVERIKKLIIFKSF